MKINDLFETFLKSITDSEPPLPIALGSCHLAPLSPPGRGWDRAGTGQAPGRAVAGWESRDEGRQRAVAV